MPYSFREGRYIHDFPAFSGSGRDILLNPSQGIALERNLLTLATSRSGKGACQIVPNLLHWPHNALVIDPKGEAAELTWQAREAMGQSVHVLDPFEACKVPDRLRATLNPLDGIDPASPHAFRQINALADGLVMRHSAEAGHWDQGTCQLLAGLIAQILTDDRFAGRRNLGTLREVVLGPDLREILEEMARNPACGRLPMTGASKLLKSGGEAVHFLSGATTNTVWIDDPLMDRCLARSSFELPALKSGRVTVYLVLPFEALADYGRFLRLFVRMALFQMMQKMPDGSLKGERCLFLLDEFFSLGNIGEIAKAAGGMPGYNLHLWPFLQDLPQLYELYGQNGAQTFLANADAVFAYGINDPVTGKYVSEAAGLVTEDELDVNPPPKPQYEVPRRFSAPKGSAWGIMQRLMNWESAEYRRFRRANMQPDLLDEGRPDPTTANRHNLASAEWRQEKENSEAGYQDALTRYRQAERTIGHPRITPQEAMALTRKHDARKVSECALMMKSVLCYRIQHKAYWE